VIVGIDAIVTTIIVAPPADRLAVLERHYKDVQRLKRRNAAALACAFVALGLLSVWAAEVDIAKLHANIGRFPIYIANLIPPLTWGALGADIAEWFWGWRLWGRLILETLLIAYLGTFVGAVGAAPLCFFAAANVAPSVMTHFVTRRVLEFCRTVPEIVFALVFVVAFGLGPLPGVLAIAIHTLGALGKQFAEAVENIDMKPTDGVKAAGGRWVETMRHAALPQVTANLLSYTLMRFEINVRGAAIMGFVGAGGIGQELLIAVRKFYYADVSAMLVMIIATVMLIDFLTERLRFRFLEGARNQ
jgi:phosphonate transport system permease protein